MKFFSQLSPVTFVRQVIQEAKKVVWATRSEVVSMTIFVFIMLFLFALFFLGVDFVISSIIQWILGWQTL
jgi:preprotein translocase SecE subunit